MTFVCPHTHENHLWHPVQLRPVLIRSDWRDIFPCRLVWYQLDRSQSLESLLKCRTDRLVVNAQTSSVSEWHLLSSATFPPQFNSKQPHPFFFVSTLSWSEERCLFLSIFSLYLQCSGYRGKKSLSLCFPSSVFLPHISPSLPPSPNLVFAAFTHSFF